MTRRPTAMLEEEHHYIQKVVGVMAIQAEALENGRDVDAETLRGIVEFMRTFADKCHHGKEETHLFPALEMRGVPSHGCPLAILLIEHQRGRALVKQLAKATEAYSKDPKSGGADLARTLRSLTALYPSHIWKEDYLLFPMADKVLGKEGQKELRRKFKEVEASIGRGVHHRFEEFAKRLESALEEG